MNCVVDRGNTLTKVYLFEGNQIASSKTFPSEDVNEISKYLYSLKFEYSILSASTKTSNLIVKALKSPIILTYATRMPIVIDYESKKTLGSDRIALANAANYIYPNKNVLVISTGTCITYDFVDTMASYHGGAISPGVDMRFKAMNKYTDKLPLVSLSSTKKINCIGSNTEDSLKSGVFYGITGEINHFIKQVKLTYKDLTVVLTGGNSFLFELNIKNKIFVHSNFQAFGLHAILQYNLNL